MVYFFKYSVVGSLAVLWCILWFLVIYPSPMAHPRISQEEKDYIIAELKLEDEVINIIKVQWTRYFSQISGLIQCMGF